MILQKLTLPCAVPPAVKLLTVVGVGTSFGRQYPYGFPLSREATTTRLLVLYQQVSGIQWSKSKVLGSTSKVYHDTTARV